MGRKKKKGMVSLSIPIEIEEVEDVISLGFRSNWLEAEEGKGKSKVEYSLDVGAGMGSPWGLFSVCEKDKIRYFRFDARELFTSFINKMNNSTT